MKSMHFKKLLLLVLFPPIFLCPESLYAADFEEIIPIHISVQAQWMERGGNIWGQGTFNAQIKGEARLIEEEGELLQYEPVQLQAQVRYRHTEKDMDENSDCYGQVVETRTASGNVPIKGNDAAMMGGFNLQVFLGMLGKMHAMQWQQDIEGMQQAVRNMEKDPGQDNYTAMLVASCPGTVQHTPCNGKTSGGSFKIPLAINIVKTLSSSGMQGTSVWQSNFSNHPDLGIKIVDMPGRNIRAPKEKKGSGKVTYTVNWSFGEVKPIVQIWRAQEDITDEEKDKESEEEVLAGEKIELEAVVKPDWISLDNGKWEIEGQKENTAIKDWKVINEKPVLKKLKDKDLKKKTIRFAWIKGNFDGLNRQVKYSGKYGTETVSAQSDIRVFKPEVTWNKKIPGKGITLGAGCELVPGTRGLELEATVRMPGPFQDQPLCIQYVQLVRSNVWQLKERFASGTIVYDWYNSVFPEYRLDNSYPYGSKGPKCGKNEVTWKFLDSPGAPLAKKAASYVNESFQTYLMFRPGQGENSVWVPLSRIKWGWRGVVHQVYKGSLYDNNLPGCGQIYRILQRFSKSPQDFNPRPMDTHKYPEWTKVVRNKPPDECRKCPSPGNPTEPPPDNRQWKEILQNKPSSNN